MILSIVKNANRMVRCIVAPVIAFVFFTFGGIAGIGGINAAHAACSSDQIDVLGNGTRCETAKFTLTTTNTTSSFSFTLSAKGTFYVDCGGGGTLSGGTASGKTITRSNTTKTTYTCTYSDAGAYTIKFGGAATNTTTSYHTNTSVAAISFYVNSSETKIASISGNLSSMFPAAASGAQPRFYQTFYGATGLTSLPDTLFADYTDASIYMFSQTFFGCTGLTSLPEDLFFKNATSVTGQNYMFQATFYGCTGLTSLPANLFGKVTTSAPFMFAETFSGCASLTSIPQNLFFPNATSVTGQEQLFSYTFSGCNHLTSLPANLFSKVTTSADTMFSHTFQGCSGLTSLPQNLFFPNATSVTGQNYMFQGTFSGCHGLTSLPANLFSKVTTSAVYMFRETFSGCSNMAGYIPPTTFKGLIDAGHPTADSMFYRTFYNTQLVTECPSGTSQFITGYEGASTTGSQLGGKVSCQPVAPVAITLDTTNADTAADPATVYLTYNTKWTSDSAGNNTISALTTLPTKAGYGFNGFWTGANGTGTQIVDKNGTFLTSTAVLTFTNSATSVYADFRASYTVTYSCGTGATGDAPATATVLAGEQFTPAANTCAKADHTFSGWNDGTSNHAPGEAFTWNYNENKTFTAQWTQCQACAATNATCSLSVVNNVCTYTTACETGYVNIQNNGAYNASCSLLVVSNITYELNGGTNYSGAPTTYTEGTGATIDGVPTKAGYTFAGWCTDSELQNCAMSQTIGTNATGDKTFYAKWTPSTYNIYLENMSALPSGYTQLEYITRSGQEYIDTGFAPNQDTRVVTEFMVPANDGAGAVFGTRYAGADRTFMFVYTNQTRMRYDYGNGNTGNAGPSSVFGQKITVDFNKNYCDVYNDSETNIWSTSRTYMSFQTPNNLVFPGYMQNGTYMPDSLKIRFYSFKVYNNATLIRDYIPAKRNSDNAIGMYDTVTDTFYPNSGSGTFTASDPVVGVNSMTYTYGVGATIDANTAGTRDGYTFAGWCTDAELQNCAMTQTIGTTDTGDKTFYAKWTEVAATTYNITYTMNDGTNYVNAPATYTSGTGVTIDGMPTRTGYTFTGWTGSNGNTPQLTFTIGTSDTGDKAYTANWTQCQACAATNASCTFDGVVNNTCTYTTSCNTGYGNIQNNGAYNASCSVGCGSGQIDVAGDGNNCVDAKFSITTTNLSNNTSFQFAFSAGGVFYIDCGDGGTLSGTGVSGKIVTRTGNTTEAMYTCAYSTGGIKKIQFGGVATSYNNSTQTAYPVMRMQTGTPSLVARIDGTMGAVFPTLGSTDALSPRFGWLCLDCTNLTYISDDLFSGVTRVNTSGYAFYKSFMNCTSLTSIPKNLFSGITSASPYLFKQTFDGCTNLSGFIPPTTFAGLTAASAPTATQMLYYTFNGTDVATSCPCGMKQYMTGYEGASTTTTQLGGRVSCEPDLNADLTQCKTCEAGTTQVLNPDTGEVTCEVGGSTPAVYNITYTMNDGTNYENAPETYTFGTGATINGVPTKAGNVFAGWCTDSELTTCAMTQTIGTDATGDKTFYAKWIQCTACAATNATCSLSVVNNVCTYTTACETGYGNIQNNGAYNASCSAMTYDITYNLGASCSALPSGYTELEYIQTDGTHYINTGYYPKANTWVHTDIMGTSAGSGNRHWFNAYMSKGDSRSFGFNQYNDNAFNFLYGNIGAWTQVPQSNAIGTKHTIDFGKNQKIYIDDVEKIDLSSYTRSNESSQSLLLFARPGYTTSQYMMIGRMYDFVIYEGDNVVMNLVPARRNSDNVVGLYDTISNTFKTDGNSGSFTAGEVVESSCATNYQNAPTTYTYGVGATISGVPTKEGYTFAGWCTDAELTNCAMSQTIGTDATGDKTFYAKWTEVAATTYNITYTMNDGTNYVNAPATYTSGTGVTIDGMPTRTGYTFAGWTGSNGNTPQLTVTIGTSDTGDKAYTANWTQCQACAATNATCSLSVINNVCTYTTACETGYGNIQNNGAYNASCSLLVVSNITYELNGGTNYSGAPTTYTEGTGATIDGVPTKAGYTFAGWCTDSELQNCAMTQTIGTDATGDKTFYAKWTQCQACAATNATCSLSVVNNVCTYTTACETGYGNIQNNGEYNASCSAVGACGTPDFATIIGNTVSSVGGTTRHDGSTRGGDPASYGIAGEPDAFASDFSSLGYLIYGHARCSSESGTNNSQTWSNPTIKENVTNDLGGYCYCKIDYYKQTGSETQCNLSSSWVFGHDYEDGGLCTDNCVTVCRAAVGGSGNWINMREPMFSTIQTVASPYTYNITYTMNDGTNYVNAPATYTSGTGVTIDGVPTRTGYTFTGWTGSNGNTPQLTVTIGTSDTGDKAYTANWTQCQACAATNATCSLSVVNNTCTYTTACNAGYGNIQNNGAYNASCSAMTYDITYDLGSECSSSSLPSEYTELEYIQSDGNQYINTSYYPKTNTWVHTDIMSLDSGNRNWFSGYASKGNTRTFIFNQSNDSAFTFLYGNIGAWTQIPQNNVNGTKFAIDFGKNQKIYVDDVEKINLSSYTRSNESSQSLLLFARPGYTTSQYMMIGRMYDFVIYEGDNVVMNLIPAKRNNDNVLGLYDTVSGTFFTNAGSGTFAPGDPVSSGAACTNYVNAPSTYTSGTGVTINGTPTGTGLVFAGWCTDAELQNCAMTQTISASDTGDKTFYAKWTQCQACAATNATCSLSVINNVCTYTTACETGYGNIQNSGAYNVSCPAVICATGYYLPQDSQTCSMCTANSYCSGGNYEPSNSIDQGIASCGTGLYSPAGMWESAQCGHILHVGDAAVYLRGTKKTSPALHIKIGNDVFYGNMTTADVVMSSNTQHKLKVYYDNTTYSVYDDSVVLPQE